MPPRLPAGPFVLPSGAARSLIPGMPVGRPYPGMPKDQPNEQGQEVGPPGLGAAPILAHQPGGNLVQALQPNGFTTFEQLYRAAPEEAWFSPEVSPSNPVQFDLGSFQVPINQHLWIMDYEFSVYRQSGVDPGDILKAEDGRFSGVMGFDININGRRMGNLLYQLDPQPVQDVQSAFQPPIGTGRATQAQFDSAAFNSFASTSGQGISLLPVRRARQGVDSSVGPFTMIAQPTNTVTLTVVIFKTVLNPITAIEGRFMGFTVAANLSSALLMRTRPR